MPDGPIQEYLRETLGLAPQLGAWLGEARLPYALRDPFEFSEGLLLGQRLVLARQRETAGPMTAGEIADKVRRIEAVAGCPVVYVTARMPGYERARLVAQKIPFIVPEAQLYLPDVGIDFRERLRGIRQAAVTHFAPATQALLVTHLLWDQWEQDWAVTEAATERHYTAMTATRVARELVAAGLFTEQVVKRQRLLRPSLGPRETWAAARAMCRTPIVRRFWLAPDRARALASAPLAGAPLAGAPLAGVSALAELTMLGAPAWPITALDAAAARGMTGYPVERMAAGAPVSDGPVYEVWRYAPTRGPGAGTVDPLSLILSLQSEDDARVQGALRELDGLLPW